MTTMSNGIRNIRQFDTGNGYILYFAFPGKYRQGWRSLFVYQLEMILQ